MRTMKTTQTSIGLTQAGKKMKSIINRGFINGNWNGNRTDFVNIHTLLYCYFTHIAIHMSLFDNLIYCYHHFETSGHER